MSSFHLPDDDLELNALGRLPDDRVFVVHQHLRTCATCRSRQSETFAYVAEMQKALEQFALSGDDNAP